MFCVTVLTNLPHSMNISWNGLGSIVLTAKPALAEVSLVTNPFTTVGSLKFPKSLEASIIVQSHQGDDTDNLDAIIPEHDSHKKPFIVDHAGEYEVQGVFVTGVMATKKDGTIHTIYRFDVEGMHVGFLGSLDRTLSTKELEAMGAIDILLLPAGGNAVLSASGAAEVIAQIEPRIVIPLYVSSAEGDGCGDVASFTREVAAPTETVTKYKIVKAGLPEEDMQVVVLTKA